MPEKSHSRFEVLRNLIQQNTDDCIEWPYNLYLGYGSVMWRGRRYPTNRLALILTTGLNPSDKVAAHGPCHNRACVNPRHLSWKTRAENLKDRERDGTAGPMPRRVYPNIERRDPPENRA